MDVFKSSIRLSRRQLRKREQHRVDHTIMLQPRMETNIRIIRLATPITDLSEAKAMPKINLMSTAILLG
jgi:hypothetical protein